MMSEPSRRISACRSPTALLVASSERKEFEHTSSARPSVRCASVILTGRISCIVTGIPDLATCQAASEPARPAPMICTVSENDFVPVIATEVARSGRYDNARGRARALSQKVGRKGSAVEGTGRNPRNVRAIEADIGQLAIAKLGQFADVALIVPERLDHANEREQHGNSPCIDDSALERSLSLEGI